MTIELTALPLKPRSNDWTSTWEESARHLLAPDALGHQGRVRLLGDETPEELEEAHAWLHAGSGNPHALIHWMECPSCGVVHADGARLCMA